MLTRQGWPDLPPPRIIGVKSFIFFSDCRVISDSRGGNLIGTYELKVKVHIIMETKFSVQVGKLRILLLFILKPMQQETGS